MHGERSAIIAGCAEDSKVIEIHDEHSSEEKKLPV